jgi:hypothetical protein
MSFRLFIYYCAAWGAAAGYFGWALGRLMEGEGAILAGLKGMSLGLFVSLFLGLLDALCAGSRRNIASIGIRLLLAMLIGSAGGLGGGFLGQVLLDFSGNRWAMLAGWALTGLLIGVALAASDFFGAVLRNEDRRGSWRKLRNGLLGGTVGGLLGGVALVLLYNVWSDVFPNANVQDLWSPSASGFVALGACIGLTVALTQVILREASLRVEAGSRLGQQVLLTRRETLIGRTGSCDVSLFGDPGVAKVHARIKREGNVWTISDAGTPSGTLLNGQRVAGPTQLHSGDRIQVGESVLLFAMRGKETAGEGSVPALI